ncbi:MAG: PadR family transcriptional regulator, partial [Candidatus Binatia bacterium]
QPRHGYELRQEVERRLYATYINLSGGSLYYNLSQLERAGYIEKAWAEQKGRYPTRQVYQLTPAGQDYLRTELRRLLFDTGGRDRFFRFDPLNAALAFGHFIDPATLYEAVRVHLEWAKESVRWIEQQRQYWQTQDISLVQSKIIEHGLIHLQAEVEWLEQFLRDLEVQMTKPLKQVRRANVS